MSTAIRRRPSGTEMPRVTMPKPGKTRPRRRVRQRVPGQYNPRVASRGLTLDTGLGPVDTVAVDRAEQARDGDTVSLTAAEREVLITRLALRAPATRWNGQGRYLARVAETIGVNADRLADKVYARRKELRAAGLYPANSEGAGHG
jgi:hypothetical protein